MYVAAVNLRIGRKNIAAGQALDGLPPDTLEALARDGMATLTQPEPAQPAQKPTKPAHKAQTRQHRAPQPDKAPPAAPDDENSDEDDDLPEPSAAERQSVLNSVVSAAYEVDGK